jgi:hypothetical protein
MQHCSLYKMDEILVITNYIDMELSKIVWDAST